jgi:NAD-dependent DNA ligase
MERLLSIIISERTSLWLNSAKHSRLEDKPSLRASSRACLTGPLLGESVVFTGTLSIPRDVAANMAQKTGGKVSNSVTRRTTILVVGDQDLRQTKGEEKAASFEGRKNSFWTASSLKWLARAISSG